MCLAFFNQTKKLYMSFQTWIHGWKIILEVRRSMKLSRFMAARLSPGLMKFYTIWTNSICVYPWSSKLEHITAASKASNLSISRYTKPLKLQFYWNLSISTNLFLGWWRPALARNMIHRPNMSSRLSRTFSFRLWWTATTVTSSGIN